MIAHTFDRAHASYERTLDNMERVHSNLERLAELLKQARLERCKRPSPHKRSRRDAFQAICPLFPKECVCEECVVVSRLSK